MTDRAQNANFRRNHRFLQIHPFSWKFRHSAGNRRKPLIFEENRRKPPIGVCHVGSVTLSREETKVRFRKRAVLANVPLFRFFVPGNIRMCLRSLFLVPGNIRMYPRSVFVVRGNIRQNHPFGNHPFANLRLSAALPFAAASTKAMK